MAVLLLTSSIPAVAAPWRASERNSFGWQFMTPDERVEHQRRLRGFRSYEECRAYQDAHHARMVERAREAGALLTPTAHSVCDRLRAQGRLR